MSKVKKKKTENVLTNISLIKNGYLNLLLHCKYLQHFSVSNVLNNTFDLKVPFKTPKDCEDSQPSRSL